MWMNKKLKGELIMKIFNNGKGKGNDKSKEKVVPVKPEKPIIPVKPEEKVKPEKPEKPQPIEPIEGMNLYIGVKVINAQPMMKYEALALIEGEEEIEDETEENEIIPLNDDEVIEIDDDEIEDDEEGYLVIYENGYVSWSPKAVFEEAYSLIREVSFETAIKILERVERKLKNK
jgi:hypothetical protein